MLLTKTWGSISALYVTMMLGCSTQPGDEAATAGTTGASTTGASTSGETSTGQITADAGSTGQGSETTADTESSGTDSETGDPPDCDPSDDEIGPAVEVTILNETDAALYLTESTECNFGAPFAITFGGQMLGWLYGICNSCSDALQGLCQCPGPCAQDTVIRIDAGGRYVGTWPGAELFSTMLPPGCTDDFCGGVPCLALTKSEAGDYIASAVASPMIVCDDINFCDCMDAPDPDGWCRIGNAHADVGATVEAPFAYPGETAVDIAFP